MDPALALPFQQLITTLTGFATSLHAAQPAGAHASRWKREVEVLTQALGRLRSQAEAADPSPAVERLARRLTQLARSQDGLLLEASAGPSAAQLRGERQMVVLAAWQLLQALEQASARHRGAASANVNSVAPAGTAR